MKRFLIAGRLDGQFDGLATLQTLVDERKPDGVLFAGGILGEDRTTNAEKLKKWDQFFKSLDKLGVFTAVIPGTADVPAREFLRMATAAEVAHPNLHVVHA